MSDLERSLRALAGPVSEVDLDAVGRRAGRIRRRRQGAIGGVVASLLIVAMVLMASAWDGGDEQSVVVAPPETTEAPETTEPAPSDEPEPEVSCPAPRLAPTYLPWAGELPDPAEPDRVDPVDSGLWALYLDDPDGAPLDELDFFATMAVSISTRPSLDDLSLGPREVTSIGELRGQEAYLVWVGDPGVGGVFIAWDEDDGSPCSAYRVGFPSTAPIAEHLGLTAIHESDPVAPIEDELIRVVESLRHLDEVGSEEADIAHCPPSELHPTYVPWDLEGGPLEPVDEFEGDDGSVTTVYTNLPDIYERRATGESVHLYVTRMGRLEVAEEEPYRSMYAFGEIRGADGYLGWTGDVGVGPVSLAWQEQPGEPCGVYRVMFAMTHELAALLRLSPGETGDTMEVIEAELVRVVEALERR